MGLGQTMLTVGFLVLLTFAVVSINKMVVDKDQSFYEKEVLKQSGTLADALFEEIATKRFDEKADTAYRGDSGFARISIFRQQSRFGLVILVPDEQCIILAARCR
jgi:hypothetical protein